MASLDLEWSAPEFHYYEKGARWYAGAALAALAAIAVALWNRNFLFAAFIGIAAAVVVSWTRRRPNTIAFSVSERGVEANGKRLYALDELEAFALVPETHDPAWSELILRSKRQVNRWARILVPREDHERVRLEFAAILPEEDYTESALEAFLHILRF
jgi:hypothetical protein